MSFAAKDHEVTTQMNLPNQKRLNQYFTPRWVAQAVVSHYFSDLAPGSTVVEPGCGEGRFLMALPKDVNALGVEIDPVQAQLARDFTGRQVITGDFLTVPLPLEVDAVLGNPPFVASTVAAFLERSHELLKDGGRCGLILPTYVLQTHSRVASFSRKWSIQTELMPRNLFPGLSLPITFTVFTKDHSRKLFGFFLYKEAADVAMLKPDVRVVLATSTRRGSVWRQAVNAAFDHLGGGAAHLADLYAAVLHKPAENNFCDQQIRKVLQTYPEFVSVGRGVWARSACNDAFTEPVVSVA